MIRPRPASERLSSLARLACAALVLQCFFANAMLITFALSPLDAIVSVRWIAERVARDVLGVSTRCDAREIRTFAASPLETSPFDVSTTWRAIPGLPCP